MVSKKIRRLPKSKMLMLKRNPVNSPFENVLVVICSLFSSTSGGAFVSSGENDMQSLSNGHMDINLPETSSFAVRVTEFRA